METWDTICEAPFKHLSFNLILRKNCDSDGLLFDEGKLKENWKKAKRKLDESPGSKGSSHLIFLRRIYWGAGGMPALDVLTNQNKISWLNETAILTIENQDMSASRKRNMWMQKGIHYISGHIIFIFISSILNNLVLLLEVFHFVAVMQGQSHDLWNVSDIER
jgi:hypothetical protein